jgi:hypothetical protein
MIPKITDINKINLAGVQLDVNSLLKKNIDKELEEDSDVTEQEQPDFEAELESAVSDAYSTPIGIWRQECELFGLTMGEAAKVLDSVMSRGFYEENYRVAGRVFKLRTRTTVDGDRLIEMLRELRPDNNAVLTHLVARINLASSLSAFNTDIFPHTYPKDDNREQLDTEWKSRWDYTSALPQPIFLAVTQTLQRFDEKVHLACDARALENF